MRLIALVLPLVAIVARGQDTWTYLLDSVGFNGFVTDIVVDPEGATVSSLYQDSLLVWNRSGDLVRLSSLGVAVSKRSLGGEGYVLLPTNIIPGTDGALHTVGPFRRTTEASVGFFHYRSLSNGIVLDSSLYQIPGYNLTGLENAVLTNSGNIFLGGSGRIQGLPAFTYSTLLQIGQNGDSLNYLELGSSNAFAFRITRGIAVNQTGTVVAMEKPNSNDVDYRIFDDNLGFLDGWSGQEPHADPNPLVFPDSLLGGALTIRPLNNGDYIVGGQIENFDYDRRSAVYRINDTGAVNKMFSPSTPYPNDYCAQSSTLSNIDDNTFYFASWRNFALTGPKPPYTPFEPDQIAVYKLDNDLNVLCEYVLDGFADNAYYVPYRIKTAPDGGFVLLGGRKDMSDPNSIIVSSPKIRCAG
jgi:hypothetical protein